MTANKLTSLIEMLGDLRQERDQVIREHPDRLPEIDDAAAVFGAQLQNNFDLPPQAESVANSYHRSDVSMADPLDPQAPPSVDMGPAMGSPHGSGIPPEAPEVAEAAPAPLDAQAQEIVPAPPVLEIGAPRPTPGPGGIDLGRVPHDVLREVLDRAERLYQERRGRGPGPLYRIDRPALSDASGVSGGSPAALPPMIGGRAPVPMIGGRAPVPMIEGRPPLPMIQAPAPRPRIEGPASRLMIEAGPSSSSPPGLGRSRPSAAQQSRPKRPSASPTPSVVQPAQLMRGTPSGSGGRPREQLRLPAPERSGPLLLGPHPPLLALAPATRPGLSRAGGVADQHIDSVRAARALAENRPPPPMIDFNDPRRYMNPPNLDHLSRRQHPH